MVKHEYHKFYELILILCYNSKFNYFVTNQY